MKIEDIAKICHEVNRAYCEVLGDFSQVSWEDAADWQKDSAIKGVKFKINNPNVSAEDQHIAWVEDKINQGWVCGEKKDPDKKTHPCIVPYKNLPKEEKKKDELFKTIVSILNG